MAKKTRSNEIKTTDYRHTGEKRPNIPPARIAAEGKVPAAPKVRYRYSPHLPPELRFDPSGKTDKLPALIDTAGNRPLTPAEQKVLAEALRQHEPWLEWAGKQEQHERGFFDVDPVALHIHERISTQAMLRALAREDVQRDLFADPQQPYAQAVQFYKHSVEWTNRLILGDSLQVMTSLARRENLAGKVQMIYMDPPYGIKFSSNFQPLVSQREVKDRDQDLTREPEMVRAYRDTWTLGVHSYLAYLRDRFFVARELLADTGSIFVQIGEENLHRVRATMDEVFGAANVVAQVSFFKTGAQTAKGLPQNTDFLLWYAKDATRARVRRLYRSDGGWAARSGSIWSEGHSGDFERSQGAQTESRRILFTHRSAESTTGSNASRYPVDFSGRRYTPKRGWSTDPNGFERLMQTERIFRVGENIRFKVYLEDFPLSNLTANWDDTGAGSFLEPNVYVVQTVTKVIERCLLMTTEVGEIVVDPTCGSGSTAWVAELWGRRWITCDTSRVALALARQRIMTARLPYYQLRQLTTEDTKRNPDGVWLTDRNGAVPGKMTFKCKTVPHITLKSIARNPALDPIFARHEPILTARLDQLNEALKMAPSDLRQKLQVKLLEKQKRDGKKAITDADLRRWMLPPENRDKSVKWTVDADFAGWYDWEVPFDTDPDWPKPLQDALVAYRAAWRAKMDDVNTCIAANADVEELVDKAEVVSGVVRVSGPFTVEGVRPEELSLGEEGLFDPTPNEFEPGETQAGVAEPNAQAYLAQIVQHLRADGVTFMNNQKRKLDPLEALFEDASASLIHAEGRWADVTDGPNTVAITFGPQHGPVTALQVEETIRAASRYTDLVVAGFSFDAEVWPIVEQQVHPKLRIHVAQIRPDLNQAMEGLSTPNRFVP